MLATVPIGGALMKPEEGQRYIGRMYRRTPVCRWETSRNGGAFAPSLALAVSRYHQNHRQFTQSGYRL